MEGKAWAGFLGRVMGAWLSCLNGTGASEAFIVRHRGWRDAVCWGGERGRHSMQSRAMGCFGCCGLGCWGVVVQSIRGPRV